MSNLIRIGAGEGARAVSRAACAAAGAAAVVVGWFAPTWAAACAALCVGVLATCSARVRASTKWREIFAAAGVFAVLAAKDICLPGPLGGEAVARGLVEGFGRRQPDVAAALASASAAALCVVGFAVLRNAFTSGSRRRAFVGGAAAALAGLAVVVLTAAEPASAYGVDWHVGALLSRNAAAGAMAIGAVLSAGLAIDGWRERRTARWAAAVGCAAACAGAAGLLGSRGGLVALLAGLGALTWCWAGAGARRWAWVVAGLAVAGLWLAPTTVARFAEVGKEYRWELWAGGARALGRAPWGGVGGGGFAEAFALFAGVTPAQGTRVVHPDSSWVLWWTEWGTLAFAAGVFAIWRVWRSARSRDDGVGGAAEAAVVAWAVAAVGDVSFHRPLLLLIGVPLFALARSSSGDKAEEPRTARGACARAWVLAGLACALALAWSWPKWREARVTDVANARERPFDQGVNHRLGFEALRGGDLDEAVRRWRAVLDVDPANADAARLYADALMATSAERALGFWERCFAIDKRGGASVLAAELKEERGPGRDYWWRACRARPELWLLLADGDEPAAQRCYDAWRALPLERRGEPWVFPTLVAMARWGTASDLARWLALKPVVGARETRDGARRLLESGRGDLAWAWLSYGFPEPKRTEAREVDATLRARTLANPSDHVALMRLVDQTGDAAERLRLLERAAAEKDAPAAFRVRLAYALKAAGRGPEALRELLAAAEAAVAGGR